MNKYIGQFFIGFCWLHICSLHAQNNEYIKTCYDNYLLNNASDLNFYKVAADQPAVFIMEERLFLMGFTKEEIDSTHQFYYQVKENYLMNFDLNADLGLDLNIGFNPTYDGAFNIIQVYDVDKDKHNDLIVNDWLYIYWMKNNGAGAFAKPQKILKADIKNQMTTISSYMPGIVMVETYKKFKSQKKMIDCRASALPKVINMDYTACGLAQIGSNSFEVRFNENLITVVNTNTKKQMNALRVPPNFDYVVSDFNNDAWPDIIYSDNLNVYVAWGNEDGSYILSSDLMNAGELSFINALTHFNIEVSDNAESSGTIEIERAYDWLSGGRFKVLDINKDGYLDVLFQGEYLIAFINNGNESFSRQFVGGPYDPETENMVDMNNDKLLDILVNAYAGLYLIINRGTRLEEIKLSEVGYAKELAAFDMDADGDMDIVIVGADGILRWMENVNNQFKEATFWLD